MGFSILWKNRRRAGTKERLELEYQLKSLGGPKEEQDNLAVKFKKGVVGRGGESR